MRRTTAVLTNIAAAAAVLVGGAAGASSASAAESTTGCEPMDGGRTYLAAFGDPRDYVLAPGGSFGDDRSPWSFSGAAISRWENSPFDVTDQPGTGAASIAWGGRITSPEMCVRWQDDRVRFFYRATAGMSFKVTTTTRSTRGTAATTTWVTAPTSGWNLTPPIAIADYTDDSGTQLVRVQVANPLSWSPIKVDDVLVDPWRARGW